MAHAHIYVASKTVHAPMWRRLRARGAPVCSSWIDEALPGETIDWPLLWARCKSEIAMCDGLVAYAEHGEILKGAFLEMGMALALNKPVVWVGPQDLNLLKQDGIWFANSIEDALRKVLDGPLALPLRPL